MFSRSFDDEIRARAQDVNGGPRAAGNGRRQRVREELRPRTLRKQVAHLRGRGDVPAGGAAQRLAERARQHVHLAEHAEVLDDTAAGLADHADAVRVVHEHDRVVRARQLEDVRQLGEVPLHREDAVREDQLPLTALARPQRVAQLAHVGVRVAHLRSGFASAPRR